MGTLIEEAPTRRDWMAIGATYHVANRQAVEEVIAGLTWQTDGDAPACPALAINEVIRELRIPKVSAVATDGCLSLLEPDGVGIAHYAVYGIEGNYTNGRVRIYVLDAGSLLKPLAADLWEK